MKKMPIIDKILNNWIAKLVCFSLAILLYAFYQVTSVDTRNIAVKLSLKAEGNMVAASSVPSFVRLHIRGKQEDISAIQESDISAFLDLSFYNEPGEIQVPVMLNLAKSVTVINPLEITVSPEYIPISLEEKSFAIIPVSPVVQGSPARGYDVASYSIMPSSVRVTGPKSMVDSVQELSSDVVSIDGATKSISKTVPIYNTNNYISVDAPSETTITVEIQPILQEKTFQNVPIYLSAIDSRLEIAANKRLSVTVSGPMVEIEDFEFGEYTVQANCSKITSDGDYSVPLTFFLPNSFKIVSQTFDSVPVTAMLKPDFDIHETDTSSNKTDSGSPL